MPVGGKYLYLLIHSIALRVTNLAKQKSVKIRETYNCKIR